MWRLLLSGIVTWLMISTPALTRADDAEDKAVKLVEKLGGKVTRDDKLPGKPIVRVDLGRTKVTDAGLKELTDFKDLTMLNPGSVAGNGSQLCLDPACLHDRTTGGTVPPLGWS